MQSRDRVQSLLTHRCSARVLDSSEYSVQALMVSVAFYCLLCIVLQHSNIIFCFFLNIVMLCVVLCFNAYVVTKFDDNEHCSCSCSDWALCDIKRGRFAIHCFGTMLEVEGLEKRLSLGLQGLGLVAKIRRLGLVELYEGFGPGLVSDQKPNVSVSSRSGKLRSRLHPCHAVLPRSKQTPCQVNHHRKYLSEIQWWS